MIGISGGGWATTVYPAIDDRISKSFAVSANKGDVTAKHGEEDTKSKDAVPF